MLKTYITSILLCLSIFANAQQNFKPGYILSDSKSDTTFGQIDYQNWKNNPKEIRFQNNNNQTLNIFTSEITAFGILNEEHYQTKLVSLDTSPYEEGNLMQSPNRIIIEDTLVSLLVLVSGENSLYFLKDQNDKQHFFLEKQNEITELINHRYLIEQNSRMYLKELPLYRAQLEALFADCSDEIKIDGIPFNKKTLTKKIIEYNECVGCTYLCYYEKKKDLSKTSFGISLSYNFENKNFSHRDLFRNVNSQYTLKSSGLTYGINTEITLPRALNRNKIYIEASYIQEQIETELKDYLFKFGSINLTGLYKRDFTNLKNVSPYFGLGLGFKCLIVSYDKRKFRNIDPAIPQLLAEIGLKKNNLTIFARTKGYPFALEDYKYYHSNPAEIFDEFTYKKLQFQFGLSYFLFNKTN